MKGTQTCVLISQSSTTCDVDDETELSFELGQPNGFTLDRSGFEIVQTGHYDSFDSRMDIEIGQRLIRFLPTYSATGAEQSRVHAGR
jgi:hypothetical protein